MTDAITTETVGGQDSFHLAFPQLELGKFPTVHVPRLTDTAASRSADFMVFPPWRISKDLARYVAATPRLQFLGSESLNGATVTPTIGAYSFTKNGRPQNLNTDAEGDCFSFNGSTDSFSIAAASAGDFLPAGSFSIVAAFTPLNNTSSNSIMGRYTAAGNQRAWVLTQSATAMNFTISLNGTDTYNAQVASCLEIGKPVLITGTYNSASGLSIRVDAFTAGTQAVTGQVHPANTADLYIANHGSGAPLSGKLHYLAYYDNYVISAAEHANMYAAFKQDGILPLTMSDTTPKTKLIIECECKGQYSSTTDMGATRPLVIIGGNRGTASGSRNLVYMFAHSNGTSICRLYRDSEASGRDIKGASARTDHNICAHHKWVIDCTDLSISTYHINGVAQTGSTGLTGTADFDFSDCLIRIGQLQDGTVSAHAEIRNPKIYAE
jgi:hypothetical protein